jgi:PEP-CTERM motif
MKVQFPALLLAAVLGSVSLPASVVTFGTEDCLETGCYGTNDPTAGATLQGLAPGAVTLASMSFAHSYPFTPAPGDFAGTDQIYVGSVQTDAHDGYSDASQRINGPDVLVLDYSSLIAAGQTLTSLTLGIAADDFQFPVFGQPFTASINGVVSAALTTQLESLNETGPVVQFFTIGLNPSIDTGSHILTLSIDEGGDGGDGYALDFLTVGVTTTGSGGGGATPEPGTISLLGLGGLAIAAAKWHRL